MVRFRLNRGEPNGQKMLIGILAFPAYIRMRLTAATLKHVLMRLVCVASTVTIGLLATSSEVVAAIPDELHVEKLSEAIHRADIESVKSLTSDMDEVAINVEVNRGRTFLHLAIEQYFKRIARIKSQDTPDADNEQSQRFRSIIDHLLSKKASPEARDKSGYSPVLLALEHEGKHGHFEFPLTTTLIRHGGEVNSIDYRGNNIFHIYVGLHSKAVRMQRAYRKLSKTTEGKKLLSSRSKSTTAISPPTAAIPALIDLGVDINFSNDDGLTPLLVAAHGGANPDLVEALIKYGADPTAVDNDGRSVIHLFTVPDMLTYYVSTEQLENLEKLITLLTENGVDINAYDNRRQTALSYTVNHALRLEEKRKQLQQVLLKRTQNRDKSYSAQKLIERGKKAIEGLETQTESLWTFARFLIGEGSDPDVAFLSPTHGSVTKLMQDRPELALDGMAGPSIFEKLKRWLGSEEKNEYVNNDAKPAPTKEKPRNQQKSDPGGQTDVAQSAVSKVTKNDRTEKKRKRTRCELLDKTFPEEAVIYATGAYSGRRLNRQIDQSGGQAGQIDVTVNYTNQPVILMFGAYDPTIWTVKRTPGTKIIAILASGHHRQAVSGVDESTQLTISDETNNRSCGSFYIGKNSIPSNVYSNAKMYFKQDVDDVVYAENGRAHVGEPISDESELISSGHLTPESFYIRDADLAGPAGLEYGVSRGFLRKANADDIKAWENTLLAKFGENHFPLDSSGSPIIPRPSVYNTFVVLKEYTLPKGLYGGHSASFLVPKGVPVPKGDLGHSRVFDLNTGQLISLVYDPIR